MPNILRQFLRKMTNTFAISKVIVSRALASVIQFLMLIIAARMISADGVGIYTTFASWTYVFGTAFAAGLPIYVLRATASHVAAGRVDRSDLFVKQCLITVISIGATSYLLFELANEVFFASRLAQSGYLFALRASVIVGILLALLRVLSEALKGRGRPNIAFTLEFSTVPLIIIAAAVALAHSQHEVTTQTIILFHALGSLIAVFLATIIAFQDFRFPRSRSWVKIKLSSLSSLWAISMINNALVFIPYYVLPFYAPPDEIGQFGVAHRLVGLSGTILVALAAFFGPRFAAMSVRSNTDNLRSIYRQSSAFLFLLSVPVLMLFVFLGHPILSLFGESFTAGAYALAIMAGGRVINAAAGLTECFLSMVGKERFELYSAGCAILSFVIMVLLLAPADGMNGIALAYTIAFVVRAVLSRAFVQWHFVVAAQAN